ncbi:MAG: Wzz/FepE/Etk N-terminal domain-containing protein [Bacteroidota bacterium]
MKQDNNKDFNASSLILLLWEWRKRIIIVMIVTAVVSSVVSLLMQEKYKSTAIIFPAKSNTVLIGEMLNPNQSSLQVGEEEEAEQMLQILNSALIRNKIIEKYNLMTHYEIDTGSKYKNTNLIKEYEENVKCSRTRYGSIIIEVLDHSPDTAMLIANDIATLVDSAKNKMLKERALQAFRIVEKEYNSLTEQRNTLVDTLGKLSMMGVVSSSAIPALLEVQANAIKERDMQLMIELDTQIKMNRRYGSISASFAEQLELKNKRLEEMEAVYIQAKSDAYSPYTYKFEVEPATKAEKKSYPIRWLIVFISTVSSFFFMVFLIMSIEKIKELKSISKK